MKIFVLVAAAAMALVSCQKNEIENPAPQEYEYTFLIGSADDAESKAAIGNENVVWEEGDRMGVYTKVAAGTISNNAYGDITPGAPATMKMYSNQALATGDYIYAYYPYDESNKNGNLTVTLNIPTIQDGKDDMPMVAIPHCVESAISSGQQNAPVGKIKFANLGSVIEFHVYSTTEAYQTELVKSVTFNADQAIAGNFTFDISAVDYSDEETLAIAGYEATSVVSTLSTSTQVSADKNAATVVKMVVAPGTYTGNIVVTTDKATYTYPISTAKEFNRSAVKPLGVNLKAENRAENTAVDYSGSYAIVAKSGEKFYYLTNVDSGANTKRLNSMEISSLPAENANLDASVVWNLIAKGDGTYYIQSAENDLYLDHHAKSSNSATLEQTTSSVISMAVEPTNDGRYMISYENETDGGTEIRKLVKNSQDSYFAFYTSEQSGAVYLIPAVAVKIPAIQIETLVLAEAEGGEVSVNYSIKNPTDGKNLTATETCDWLSVAVEEGQVIFNIDENDVEEERTAAITLAYDGAESVVVTVTQAAKAAVDVVEKEVVIDMTAQSFANQETITTVTKTPISIVFDKGTNSNSPKYYTSGTAIRVYGGNNFTISSDKTIVKIVLTFGSSDGSNAITTDVLTYSNGTWTGSANSVTFTIGGTSGNRRIQKVAVTYEDAASEGGDEPVDPVQLKMSDITCSAQTENSLTFTWTAVANATGYDVTCNDKTETVTTTQYVATDLAASTSYTISIVAKGDGINYTNSAPKTQTGTTSAASTGGEGSTRTIKFKVDKTTTGSTSTSYVTTAKDFTYEGVGFKVNNWNPSTLQVRGNQTANSSTNLQSCSNFMLRNTSAIPGKIKSISIEYTSGTLEASNIYVQTGSSEITTQKSTTSIAGTAGSKVVTWNFEDGGSYFALGMLKGGTSGTAISGNITITYEEN